VTKSPLLQLKPFQMVLLIAGPAGSGKTSIAQKIGATEGWAHISEDDTWNEIGHPPGELRQEHEQVIVHERVHDKLLQQLGNGNSVVLEFILFHNPPQPLFDYQSFLTGHGIPFETRILRPSLEAIVHRAKKRGREADLNQAESFRANTIHQLGCVSAVDPAWIVDDSGDSFEVSFERHFRRILIKGLAQEKIETIEKLLGHPLS
jgi:adenylate kinase family enzyme